LSVTLENLPQLPQLPQIAALQHNAHLRQAPVDSK